MNWKLVVLVCILGVSQKVFSQGNSYPPSGKVIADSLVVNSKLMVKGTGSYNYNPNRADLQVGLGLAVKGTSGSISRLALQPYGHVGGPWLFISRDTPTSAYLDLNYGISNMITIHHLGNIGIGTLLPTEKLSVNGNIRAKEIKVETANWPDYVFKKDYELTSLAELGEFVRLNHHLPGVPKATEVETNGLELGEMNKILLKKIEELTLHLISKDEEFKNLNKMVSELDAKLNHLISNK